MARLRWARYQVPEVETAHVSYGKMAVGATAHAAAARQNCPVRPSVNIVLLPSLSLTLAAFAPTEPSLNHIPSVLNENYHILSQAIALVGSASLAL